LQVPVTLLEPRPYQVEGIDFLVANRKAILADQMGLGKTGVAISAFQKAKAYPVLVVCPAGIKSQWVTGVGKWVRDLKVSSIDSPRWEYNGEDVVVVNSERLLKIKDLGFTPETLVLDEAHKFKSTKSQRAIRIRKIAGETNRTWMLTGTPVYNRRDDLHHLLQILGKSKDVIFHAYPNDGELYVENDVAFTLGDQIQYLKKMPSSKLHDALKATVMLRRLKVEVAPDLPKIHRIWNEFDGGSEAYFEAERELIRLAKDVHNEKQSEHKAMMQGFGIMQTMRAAAGKSKIQFLVEAAQEWYESGERAVIFTAFKENGKELAALLPGKVVYMDGDVKPKHRGALIAEFQESDFLVATVGVSGEGLDGLQVNCKTMAFLDLLWTPTAHEQAEGRIDRGLQQVQQVQSFYFSLNKTMDETMKEMLDTKEADRDAIVDGQNDDEKGGFIGKVFHRLVAKQAWSEGRVDWKRLLS
jgi:SWI/SNF-related matrix-associated actin-dependent regulator 1 of chromatin subfamily A